MQLLKHAKERIYIMIIPENKNNQKQVLTLNDLEKEK